MENNPRNLVDYIQDLSQKIIDKYHDEEYQIEVDFSGSIQIKGIRFLCQYSTNELENILPLIFERGSKQAGNKLNLLLKQYQEQIKKG
ncbi:MAG: hypothetical protein RJA76_552 [Bacteroidota bacterium]|jgi:hypothetical protein